MSQGREIQPIEIFRILNAAKLKAVLVGAHAVNAYTGEPRATVDVDLIAQRPKFVAKALQRGYPHLTVEDHPVVTRFKDGEREAIDVIKPRSLGLFKLAVDSAVTIVLDGVNVSIPNVYAMLALKFSSMTTLTRKIEDRYVDCRDFIMVAKGAKTLDNQELRKFGEAAYTGGGEHLLQLVADARAGKALAI